MPVCDVSEFCEGSHVRAIGVIEYGQSCPYLWLTSKDYIKIESDTKKSIGQLLKGTNTPKKKVEKNSKEPDVNLLYKNIILIYLFINIYFQVE